MDSLLSLSPIVKIEEALAEDSGFVSELSLKLLELEGSTCLMLFDLVLAGYVAFVRSTAVSLLEL